MQVVIDMLEPYAPAGKAAECVEQRFSYRDGLIACFHRCG